MSDTMSDAIESLARSHARDCYKNETKGVALGGDFDVLFNTFPSANLHDIQHFAKIFHQEMVRCSRVPVDIIRPPTPGNIVAIDPAISGDIGVAVFLEGALTACWSVKNSLDPKEHSTLERSHYAGSVIRSHVAFPSYSEACDYALVVEEPVVYPNSPVPPNDLLKVALQAGGFAGWPWGSAKSFYPSQWKGQVPKEKHHKRLLHLHPEYRNTLREVDHNAMDAFGLGVFYLQRQRLKHGTD